MESPWGGSFWEYLVGSEANSLRELNPRVYWWILYNICFCVGVCVPMGDQGYVLGCCAIFHGHMVNTELREVCCEFPRASVMHVNHISRLYYLKIKTPVELIRDNGLIWQGYCIGKSDNQSRTWTVGGFNLEINAKETPFFASKILRLTQQWLECKVKEGR